MQKPQWPPQAAEWLDKSTKLKEVILLRLESMPESQRHLAPKPGEWSAAGVVEHLVLVEECIAGPWRQRRLEISPVKPGIKSGLVSRSASFVLSKTNIRVPTVSELEPKEQMSTNELKKRWDTARASLIAALPNDSQSAWIIHPVFGPLSCNQMCKLLTSHLEHHLHHFPSP